MVQYILTPWRTRRELLLVRANFYGPSPYDSSSSAKDESQDRRHDAVAQAGMWIQRGNCPHMIESTLLLTAAILSDEHSSSKEDSPQGYSSASAHESFTVRSAYAMAFSRFVTGLLDGQQDKLRKQSMYALAKTVGLPATFVELRHESTHEALPSRAKLRKGARKALRWIWEKYWVHLGGEIGEDVGLDVRLDVRLDAVKVQDEVDGKGEDSASALGWTLCEGPWKTKPIGVV